jgi:hypothetical protein
MHLRVHPLLERVLHDASQAVFSPILHQGYGRKMRSAPTEESD